MFFEISPTDSPSSGITQNTTKRKTKMSIRNEIAKYKYSCTPNAKTDDALISAPTKTISRLSNLFKQSHLSRPSLVPRLPTTHAYVGRMPLAPFLFLDVPNSWPRRSNACFFHNPQPYQLSLPAATAWQERFVKNLRPAIL